MALEINTSHALRRPSDLLALVRAILSAHTDEETDWLEWKSTLDLTSHAGRVHLARGILGLANRMPERAAHYCEGLGYLVVGAEPGNLAGVSPIDTAKLDDGLKPFLGPPGPVWNPT